ncbi:hypothetical protein AB9F46_08545 [Rhizobium leguminosarum]|uniref:hypothetical protein n=1 Tax=Rhizobium leguminosarum TaxID=384 RepID=UPI003F9E21DC
MQFGGVAPRNTLEFRRERLTADLDGRNLIHRREVLLKGHVIKVRELRSRVDDVLD